MQTTSEFNSGKIKITTWLHCIKSETQPLTHALNTSLLAPGAFAYHLQQHTALKIQNGQKAPKMVDVGSTVVYCSFRTTFGK